MTLAHVTEGRDPQERRWIVIAGPCCGGQEACAEYRFGVERELARAVSDAGPDRTWLVAMESERPWWGPVARRFGVVHVVEQPFDRGSGTGLLVALTRMGSRLGDELVVVETGRHRPTTRRTCSKRRLLDRFMVHAPDLVTELQDCSQDLSLVYPFLPETRLDAVLGDNDG